MGSLLNYFSKIFLDAVFPCRCIICAKFFTADTDGDFFQDEKPDLKKVSFQKVMKGFLCPFCVQHYREVKSPKCTMCGFMFTSQEGEDHFCGDCIKNPSKFGKARAYGLYDGSLRKSIHRLKYQNKVYLAEPLGLLLFSTFIQNWDPKEIHVIVPIPLHRGRLQKRGFNQAFQLVRRWPEWLEKMGSDSSGIHIDQDVMCRKKRTKAQVGMNKKERIKNITGVFEVTAPWKVEEKNVLLIDDVLTTGATTNECVKALLKSGARNVDVLTLGHTERRI